MENDKENQLNKPRQPEESDVAENTEHTKWTTRKKLVAASIFIACFTALASLSIISPFFPNEALKKGASNTVVGFIFSVYPLVGIIMGPIYGKMMPRYGGKFILLTGMIVQGGSQILFGFVSDMPDGIVFIVFCFLLRIVDALGSSGCETAAIVILTAEFPSNVAAMMGAMGTIVGIGLASGPPLGGVLCTAGGFKLPFIVMGVSVTLAALILIFILPSGKEGEADEEEQSFFQTLKIPAVVIIAVTSVIGGISLSFLDPILSPHLSHFGPHGLNAVKIGFIFLISSGLYTILSPVVGWIGDRTKKFNLMLVMGLFIAGVSFMLLGPIPLLDFVLPQRAVWLACVALALLGISDCLLLTPIIPEMLQIAKHNGMPDDVATTGIMSGIYSSTMNIGAFVGPMIAGVMTEHFGFGWATASMGFVSFFQGMVLVIFNMYSKSRRRPKLKSTSADKTSIHSGERDPLLPPTQERTIQA